MEQSKFAGMSLAELLVELEDLYWNLTEVGEPGMPEQVEEALTVLSTLY